jgi:hypothetical protein
MAMPSSPVMMGGCGTFVEYGERMNLSYTKNKLSFLLKLFIIFSTERERRTLGTMGYHCGLQKNKGRVFYASPHGEGSVVQGRMS